MTRSESTSPILLKKIDELVLESRPFLRKEDEIYYLGEFTAGKLAAHSEMNRLIINYRKEVNRKGQKDWRFKEEAIQEAANRFHSAVNHTKGISERLKNAILVPIPPSATKNSPKHDDRNLRMLQHFSPKENVHEFILQKNSLEPLHSSNTKRDPKILEANYSLNIKHLFLNNTEIWLFDDVLTKGTHFRAASDFLKKHFSEIPIVGFIIAISVYPDQSTH